MGDVRYTQHSISERFTDGHSFDTLIKALTVDPTFALKHEWMKLECVKLGPWIHSNDNRRLYCCRVAQGRIGEDLKIRIRKHTLPKQVERFMGRYNTRTDGTWIK